MKNFLFNSVIGALASFVLFSVASAQSESENVDDEKLQNWLEVPEDDLILTADERKGLRWRWWWQKKKDTQEEDDVKTEDSESTTVQIEKDELRRLNNKITSLEAAARLHSITIREVKHGLFAIGKIDFADIDDEYDAKTISAVLDVQNDSALLGASLSGNATGWIKGREALMLICNAATRPVVSFGEEYRQIDARITLSKYYRDGIGFPQNLAIAEELVTTTRSRIAKLLLAEVDNSGSDPNKLTAQQSNDLRTLNLRLQEEEELLSDEQDNNPDDASVAPKVNGVLDESALCPSPMIIAATAPELRLIEISHRNMRRTHREKFENSVRSSRSKRR